MAPNKISMCGCTGHMLSQVNWTETIHGHGKQKEAASCVLELEDLGVTTWRELLTLADQWWNEQQPNHTVAELEQNLRGPDCQSLA